MFFRQVMRDQQTEESSRFLFLNKSDLFKVKISSKQGYIEFNEKFPDFKNYLETGFFYELDDIDEKREFESFGEKEKIFRVALKYIENKFRSALVDPENVGQVSFSQTMIVRHTCAVDTNHIGTVFEGIKDKIFINRMIRSGIKF